MRAVSYICKLHPALNIPNSVPWMFGAQPLQLNVHSLPPHIKKDLSKPCPFQEPCTITLTTHWNEEAMDM